MTQFGFVANDPAAPLASKMRAGGQQVISEEEGVVWIAQHYEVPDRHIDAWIPRVEAHYKCVFDGTREV
jgi:hypothetical protein